MAKIRAVSDEQIISALLQHGTVKEAAHSVGLTTRAIYDREESRAFRSAYSRARDEVLRSAVFNLNARLADAITTVSELMTDKTVNASVRLQAAQTVINTAVKLADHLRVDEKNSREEARPVWDVFGDL